MTNKQSAENGKRYGMVVQRDRLIALEDGIRLKADLYLPDPCDQPVPALVCYSPYGKEVQSMALERKALRTGQSMYDQTIEACDIAYFVEHGYAVVIPSPRGIGSSEGVNHGFLSEQDQDDCCQVITWVSKQPWSSGAVGMMGTGWAGRIQPLVAARQPSALKAIMPIDLIDDLYQENYPGGATSDYHFALGGLLPANRQDLDAMDEIGAEGVQEKLAQLRDRPEMVASSYTWRALDSWPPCFAQWSVDALIHDEPCPFWEKRSSDGKADRIKIPVYAASFYYEFGRSTVSAFNLYNDPQLQVPKKLLMVSAGFDKCSPCTNTSREMLRWYDHWLKGVDTGIMEEPPIKLFVMGENRYRWEQQWPLARMEQKKLYLADNRRMTFEDPQAGQAVDTLYHQSPTRVSQSREMIPFLEYETEPQQEDMELTGPLSAVFSLSVDQPSALVEAFVWDVAPDGTRDMLASGVTKHYPVQMGIPQECRLEMVPVSCVIRKGHKLRLHVKAMDYPLFVPSERRTFPLLFPSGRAVGPIPSTLFTHYHLYHDAEHPSYLLVPVAGKADPDQWTQLDAEEEGGNQ